MKILVINADCIFVNTSANLCHLAYIQGLVQAGHQVDVLCASPKHRSVDASMALPAQVSLTTYSGIGLYEWLSIHKHAAAPAAAAPAPAAPAGKAGLLRKLKQSILSLYGVHGIYSTFARHARRFRSDTRYDFVLSLSTPAASHLLAYELLRRKHIRADHWIQIWEDPWYSDAYGFNGKEKIKAEEKRLLSFADRVCYVSPLTLRNQQRIYPEAAGKMFWQPLPYYYKAEATASAAPAQHRYGYFGAYYPEARNLEPFYQAAREAGVLVSICGDPAGLFEATPQIQIHARLPLQELKPIEDAADVLIFLCNRKGGQIPGKIYQYSATSKTILFILDGTPEEQAVLKDYFGKFNRYLFCQNTKEDILRAIRQIESGSLGDIRNEPLECFNPVTTISNILSGGGK